MLFCLAQLNNAKSSGPDFRELAGVIFRIPGEEKHLSKQEISVKSNTLIATSSLE